jgi:HK97 family phage major capsid protein
MAPIAELKAKVDRLEVRLNRPNARIEVREDTAELERRAFNSLLRKGPDRMGDVEQKTLSTIVGSPDDGGFWTVPETFLRELQRNLVLMSPMRQVARVQTVGGGPVKLPKRTSNLSAAWVDETVQDDLSQPSYAQQSIEIHEARVSVEVSNHLLEDSAFDLAAELARDIAEEFGRLEGRAFVHGNGTTAPGGWVSSADFVSTEDTLDADGIIELYHQVPSVFAANAPGS